MILLWRAKGFVRTTLSLLAPRLFPQKKFFDSLALRQGREVDGPAGDDVLIPRQVSDPDSVHE
jgi:hypothetical protein